MWQVSDAWYCIEFVSWNIDNYFVLFFTKGWGWGSGNLWKIPLILFFNPSLNKILLSFHFSLFRISFQWSTLLCSTAIIMRTWKNLAEKLKGKEHICRFRFYTANRNCPALHCSCGNDVFQTVNSMSITDKWNRAEILVWASTLHSGQVTMKLVQ